MRVYGSTNGIQAMIRWTSPAYTALRRTTGTVYALFIETNNNAAKM